jgi:hypothetical protein
MGGGVVMVDESVRLGVLSAKPLTGAVLSTGVRLSIG